MDLQNGTDNFVIKANGPQKIWGHISFWIKGFSVKVEIRVMITYEKFVKNASKTLLTSWLEKQSKKENYILRNKIIFWEIN